MKKPLIKWIVAGILVAGIAGSFVAYKMWNKDRADASEMEGIKVNAVDLLKAFQSNEQQANANFVGKVVEVSGEVGEISGDTIPEIIINVPDEVMEGVVVTIDKRYTEEISKLKSGDKAVFKGFCSGYLPTKGVVLNDGVWLH